MRPIKLIYTSDRPRGTRVTEQFGDADVLHARLVEIGKRLWHTDCATGVELVSEAGDTMSVAIDGPMWALCHTSPDKLTQHCSIGDEAARGSRAAYWDQLTDVPRRWFVAEALAWEALREWSQFGRLSTRLHWSDGCAQ
jgi:hypothetical protein